MTPNTNYEKQVDLKWSIWSMNRPHWEDRVPGTWDWMKEWFDASGDTGNPEDQPLRDSPRVVTSSPKKEIRWGKVSISPGRMEVEFRVERDNGKVFLVSDVIEADTFEEAMHLVDHREIDLMRDSKDYGKRAKCRCLDCGYPYKSTTSNRLAL